MISDPWQGRSRAAGRSCRGDPHPDERSTCGSTMTSIWRSRRDTSFSRPAMCPADIIKAFALPANIVARNGTPVPAGDAGNAPGQRGRGLDHCRQWFVDPTAARYRRRHQARPRLSTVLQAGRPRDDPLGQHRYRNWFVAAANKCDWGADLGPTWLVTQPAAGPATIVLSVIGHRVTLKPIGSWRLSRHRSRRQGAKPAAGAHYGFNGTSYRKRGL